MPNVSQPHIKAVFARNLQALRARARSSQEATSAQLGVQRSTYSSWELGNSEPNITYLAAIQKHYNIGLDLLLHAELANLKEFQWRALLPHMQPRYITGFGARVECTPNE